jgi:hypothetical protein
VQLRDLYENYHEKIQFLMIYIREAHPVDGWWFGEGIMKYLVKLRYPKASLDTYDPKTKEERVLVAQQCEDALQYGIRTYVDDIADPVNKAYAAHPTRLYLVGEDGKVVYAGELGPFGFSPAELKEKIDQYLET